MSLQHYRQLIAWQKAMVLVRHVYSIAAKRILLLHTTLGLGFLFFYSASIALAQDVCPIKTVKTPVLSGRVVEKSKNEVPWPNVDGDLRSSVDESLIASARTNADGVFKFDSIERGMYFLEVRPGVFPTYRLVVRFQGSRYKKGGGIVVKLDPDCGKTQVLKGK